MSITLDLYPALDPYASGFLEASSLHTLYWEQCGNPDGEPVVILHGGPGEGCSPLHRRFFDPNIFRIILFDQRGCGRSTPHGEIKDNNPGALVEDINKLREHLSIKQWHVFGGSWGSTLALLYALKYKAHIKTMILRSLFLLSKSEVDWFLQSSKLFAPKAWNTFTSELSDKGKNSVLKSFHKLVHHSDPSRQLNAAIKWFLYESHCANIVPSIPSKINEDQKNQALALAKIETHFFKNHIMDGRKSLLSQLQRIRDIPLTIIQGRNDIICPPYTAQSVVDIWQDAQYYLVNNAGHSMMDSAIKNKLLEITYALGEKYKNTTS